MRFLKNILLASALSFALVSCEDENSAPEERLLLNAEDLIGKDLGISIENPSYTLETKHNSAFSIYMYGFRLTLPVSDTSKSNMVVKMAVTLTDNHLKTERRELTLDELNFYYIKNWGCYSIGLFSPHFDKPDRQYISPEYICKIRLFNADNDSSKTFAFLIKTENYPKPETFTNEWINSSDLKISLSETNSLYEYRAIGISYYGAGKEYLGFSDWIYIPAGENSVRLYDVPNDAAYYLAVIEDKYAGYKRNYSSEFQPILPREFTNIESLNTLGSVNKIEYLQKLNKLLLFSSKTKEIALIDADTYTLQWKKSLTETPKACKYDARTNKIYVGGWMGGLYSFDPVSGSQELLAKYNPGIDILDIAGNYIIAVNSSGYYMIYNTEEGTEKSGAFYYRELSKYPLVTTDFKYNPLSGKLYLINDKSVYSFNFDLKTGEASFSARDIMSERRNIWGGSALYLTPDYRKLLTGWGLIYYCSPDSGQDLNYWHTISFLDKVLWPEDNLYAITISRRYWSEPNALCIYDKYFFSRYVMRVDLAGIPLEAAVVGSKIKVFQTLKDGSLAIQSFELYDIIGN